MATVKIAYMLNKKLSWIETNLDNKIYIVLENAAVNFICQYVIAVVKMINNRIFYVPMQGIIYSVYTFAFNKLTTKIKERLVILKNVSNFWMIILKAYDNYNQRMLSPVFSLTIRIDSSNDGNSKLESILEPNTDVCNKFITITIREKVRILRLSRTISGDAPMK